MTCNQQRELSPQEAVERFISRRQSQGNAESTIRSYGNRLDDFVAWADSEGIESMRELDGWTLDEYAEHLRQRETAPATVKGKLSTLKQVLAYCEKIEVVEPGTAAKLTMPRLDITEESSDIKLAHEDAERLLEYYRDSTSDYGTVEHVLLELAWHVGGRISCFQALDTRDWHPDTRTLQFRSRDGTPLKKRGQHERDVAVPQAVADALEFYLAREHPRKRDDLGRLPLLGTHHGRASDATVRSWAYQATLPCVAGDCPHSRRPETCAWTRRDQSSKCPSSRSPHQIRTGSITWQRSRGLSTDDVAQRVGASPETIRRYYDKPDHGEALSRRRDATAHLDVLDDTTDDASDHE